MAISLLGKARSFFIRNPGSRSKHGINGNTSTVMKALVVQQDKTVAVERKKMPSIGPNDIL
ncbi:hypothetical protein CALCODRAFT_500333 [Calocera cornea HHB12733]|uniref:Uncharacterized protein n=1 Tax=Calocera cornea HHB12733 TaxID=1353952 RepID=A0A165E4V7_9BASI|nr:hypothetical protein CALCODRAFT_500333 [Calocera cornea HHB12733]